MRESKRQADVQGVLEMMQVFPEEMRKPEALPLIVEMMDVENGEKFIKAFGGDSEMDPQAAQALQEAQTVMDEQEQALGAADEHIKELNNFIIAQKEERAKDLKEKEMDSITKITIQEMKDENALLLETIKQNGQMVKQDKDIAQKGRESLTKLVNDTINENNVILERELTENDNIGMPSIVTSAPDIEIEVSRE
jgi:hypothetical protein